jgi:hypothetical protein
VQKDPHVMARSARTNTRQLSTQYSKKKEWKAGDAKRTLGVGLGSCTTADDRVMIRNMFKSAALCAVYTLPTVAKTQWLLEGPISNHATKATFGAEIDIFGSGKTPEGVDFVYNTPGLINGEFQTYMMACAVGVHLEVSPYMMTIQGNSFPRPTTPEAKPFSPDVWTTNDQTNSWPAETPVPNSRAVLLYGEPAAEAAWAMVRAYNLRWTYGSLINILDEQLRETAYMPPNAQEGSASDSELGVLRVVREVNDRYASLESTDDFSIIDTIRTGSVGNDPNLGLFTPSNAFQTAGVTYGGSDLRSKIGIAQNSEFRSLTNPYILKSGVPIGLIFEEQNELLADYMRAQLDITQGFGTGVPAAFTETPDYLTTAGTAFRERTVDGLNFLQTVVAETAWYKGFRFLLSNEIKGYEMTESLASMIRDNPDIASELCSECGVLVGWAN